jgi:trigger factor
MKINVDKQPGCTGTLRVEIPAENVRAERDKILRAFTQKARIQGFRPGKAPRQVIEKRYGTYIREELHQSLTRQAMQEALKQDDLKLLEFGEPTAMEESSDGALSFESELTLAPEFELPNYKGLTLRLPPSELSEEELEQQVEGIRQRFAEYHDIEDRPAEQGDLVVIDYHSTLDGAPLEEALGKPAGYLAGRDGFWLKLDESSFLPGFAMQLVGVRPGDQKEISVTIPEDFPVQDLRGREPLFEVTVVELKTMELPELDDAFAERLQVESIDRLREIIAEQAGMEKRRKIDDARVQQVVEQLAGQVDFELPEAMLRAETQSQADAMVQRGVESGMDEEEIAAQQQEIFTSAGMQARTRIKSHFILQEIADAEDLAVTDSELVNHLAQIAASKNEAPKKFIRQMQKEGRIAGYRNSLLISKAIDFVIEHATVEEIPPTTQDSTP